MRQTWEEVVENLERATARLADVRTEDFLEVAKAMNDRSLAVQQLRGFAEHPAVPIEPPLLDRLTADFKNGAAAAEKLILMRAAARSELSRLTERAHLMNCLASTAPRAHQHLDCTG